MSAIKEITSLKEIRERKAVIQQELDRSRKAAVNQLQETASEAKSFVLQDVVLPAVGVAVGVYLLTKVTKAAFRAPKDDTGEALRPPSVAADRPSATEPPAELAANRPPPPRVAAATRQNIVSRNKRSLLDLGALLVPAGKAILEVIRDQQRK